MARPPRRDTPAPAPAPTLQRTNDIEEMLTRPTPAQQTAHDRGAEAVRAAMGQAAQANAMMQATLATPLPAATPPPSPVVAPATPLTPVPPAPKKQTPPPPVAEWLSPALRAFIELAPEHPVTHAAVRREMNFSLPDLAEGDMYTSERILAFLVENFRRSRVYKQYYGPHTGTADVVSTWPKSMYRDPARTHPNNNGPDPLLVGVPVGTLPAANRPSESAGPALEADGSYILRNITVDAREHGRAPYSCQARFTGELRIPAHILSQPGEGIKSFIAENLGSLQQVNDVYEYVGHAPRRISSLHVQFPTERLSTAIKAGPRVGM